MRTVLSRLWSTAARGAAPGIWPLLAVTCLVSALGLQAASRHDAAAGTIRLESIAGRFDRQTSAVLIQTSEPVPYVTSQPDPLTVLVDLRNVRSAGATNRFTAGDNGAVAAVWVEDTQAFDGVPVARVRVTLTRPVEPRVRSDRNVVRVEVDRDPADVAAAEGAPSAAAPRAKATRLRAVSAVDGPSGPTIVLEGNGTLSPSKVELTKESPYRLVLDFAGLTSGVKPTTPVAKGPVDRVRVALNSSKPLVTRVVVDLTGPVAYQIAEAAERLSIIISEHAPATTSAATAPSDGIAATGPGPKANDDSAGEVDLLERVRALQAEQAAQKAPPSPAPSAAEPAAPAKDGTATTPAAKDAAPREPAAVTEPVVVKEPAAAAPQAATQPQAASGQPQQSLTARPGATQTTGKKQYSGAPISLDFAGADIRSVLRVFSETSGLNIIIDPKVQGVVDVALRDVPWDQALEIILKSANLGYVIDGNVVRIAPIGVLQDEEKQRRSLAEEQAAGASLETMTRTLSYAKADDLKGLLTRSNAISRYGKVEVDPRTNTLIVRDIAASMTTVGRILDTLDTPQPQVEIEARIVQTTRNFARQLGIQWGFSGRLDPQLGNTTGLAFPNNASVGGRTGGSQGGVPSAVNLGTTAPATSALGLSMGAVNGAFNLDVALSALETSGQGRILSTPRVLAQNNFEALMMQGVEIPIQVIANNTVTVTFKPAALQLKVTPQITAAGTVILNVQVENASPDYTKQVNNIPPINTQRANTQVLVKDNDTIVIGGVYVSQEQMQNDRTPGLHRIPLLGWLFKRDVIDDQANELLIFITPRIIKG